MADNYDDAYWHRFLTAQDAGLNREYCIKVANQEMTLSDALGGMDMDAESEYDPNFELPGDDIHEDDDDYIPW